MRGVTPSPVTAEEDATRSQVPNPVPSLAELLAAQASRVDDSPRSRWAEPRTDRQVCICVWGTAVRTNWFIVIRSNEQWWVDNEGHSFGPFPTREVAALEALDFARTLGDKGRIS